MIKRSKTIYFIFMLFMLNSCMCASNRSKEHNIRIDLKTNNSSIQLEDLTLIEGEALTVNQYVNLTFESVRGGSNYFLGYKFNESNGDTYVGRWTVACKDEVRQFTINEIFDWDYQMVDTIKVYIAPTLCNY